MPGKVGFEGALKIKKATMPVVGAGSFGLSHKQQTIIHTRERIVHKNSRSLPAFPGHYTPSRYSFT